MNLETIKVVKVFKSDKNKEGQEFKTKAGKKFYKVAIKTDKYPNDWYSCLAFAEDDESMGLSEGDEVQIVISEENGYKNFKIPSRMDKLEARVEALERLTGPRQGSKAVEEEISVEDIPF